ncbi:MAG TPA: chemotaxis protein CheW [Polyangiaceae bacterium]|nr:chemotaxis protein CheW [Polyangiaceae bacterium]
MKDDSETPETRAILERRAEILRQPRADTRAEDEAVIAIAEFSVGDERYALVLGELRAAMRLAGVTPVPLAPPHVVGIFRHTGQILPVFSFASLLGVPGWRRDPEVLLLVEPRAGQLCALDAEHIPVASTLPVAVVEQARARTGDQPVLDVTTPDLRRIHLVQRLGALLERAGRAAGAQ